MRGFRIALRVAGVIGVTLAAALAAWIARIATLGARRPGVWAATRCCRIWSRAMLALIGVEVTVEGAPPRVACVVASNHLSYLDIFVLGSLYPSVFVAKREIASWPLIGWAVRAGGTLFVDRERARDVVRAGRAMERDLALGIPLTLFPEGTATSGTEVLPFLPSLLEPAARASVPCFAATLSYDAPGSTVAPGDAVCWHDRAPFVRHFLDLVRLPRIEARVRFSGSPVRSSDRKELARRLQERVAAVFVPVRQGEASRPCAP